MRDGLRARHVRRAPVSATEQRHETQPHRVVHGQERDRALQEFRGSRAVAAGVRTLSGRQRVNPPPARRGRSPARRQARARRPSGSPARGGSRSSPRTRRPRPSSQSAQRSRRVRAPFLRKPGVGGVPDQGVAEAEGVRGSRHGAGSARRRAASCAPGGRRRSRGGSPSASHSKSWPITDARSSTASRSSFGQPVEAGGEQRVDRRRHVSPRSPPSASMESSCSTNSGLPSATSRIRGRVESSSPAPSRFSATVALSFAERGSRVTRAAAGPSDQAAAIPAAPGGRCRARRSGARGQSPARGRSGRETWIRPSGCPRTRR